MKTIVLILTAVGLAGGLWLMSNRHSSHEKLAAAQTNVSPSAPLERIPAEPAIEETVPSAAAVENQPMKAPGGARTGTAQVTLPAPEKVSLPFQQALTTLVSPQAGYDQKQAAWKQIKDSGKLSEAISELEQRAISNPNSPEFPATLGQAYLQKAGTLSDIREQGILGMKADQSFDAALNLDPSNWEAGFWKATAMSYWPPQLGKGQEVIERFVNLVKLQEMQATQPQFAQTYLLLGEQYQKQGYPDYAHQIWERGAALFPDEGKFNQKLAQPQAPQTASR